MSATESTDVVVIGSGFGGAIAAYHLAAGGAKVVLLERGPWLEGKDFEHDYLLGSSYTRVFDFVAGDGMAVLGGNCVGGGSVVYFAALPRAPRFVFERTGGTGKRLWPAAISRDKLEPWYDRVSDSIPVSQQDWNDVSYAGGLWGAMCDHSGHTANPVPVGVDNDKCVNCNWMMAGCRFDAKRSLLFNYLPGAIANGAQIRPLHEVQQISKNDAGYYRVHYKIVDDTDYRILHEDGAIDAKIVIVAAGAGATPPILQRSEVTLGKMPHGVGRYFSGNGERLNTIVLNDDKVKNVLGLQRPNGLGYRANQIGKGPVVACWDYLDENLPEFERFSLEQLYFPPGLGTILAQAADSTGPAAWFGKEKKEMLKRWQDWLIIFQMTEDNNEGVFGPPPPTGNSYRISQQMLGRGPLSYEPTPQTLRGWELADAKTKEIVGDLGVVTPWTNDVVGAYTVHPLSSCRIGDDPETSALDDRHELRGHPGIFVTDGSAVPTGVTLNPALTISALAERAIPFIVEAAKERGINVKYGAPTPAYGTTSPMTAKG
jgi:enediyne biosynthesis protein E9